jgi:triacylglycerol lipase
MYFPRGFDREMAMELGQLVVQAYGQFEAFEDGQPWKLPAPYSLLRELSYDLKAGKGLDGKGGENGLGKWLNIKRKDSPSVPIGFIASRGKRVFIVFRGTKTVKEWISNMGIGLKEYPLPDYGSAHEGFLQLYCSIRPAIIESLTQLGGRGKLYMTGHSLGAALATLALPDIEAGAKVKIDALYTFGSPRAGDDTFVQAFNRDYGRRSFRIANTSDIVTQVPFPIPLAGLVGDYFSHVDSPVDCTIQDKDLEKNHDMKTYLAALGQARSRRGFFRKLFG